MSSESPLPDSQVAVFLLSPHLWEGARKPSGVSFTRALIPVMMTPSSWPIYLPKVPPPNTITSEISFQHMNFGGGHKYSVYCSILERVNEAYFFLGSSLLNQRSKQISTLLIVLRLHCSLCACWANSVVSGLACNSMDCSLPDSSLHEILQTRTQEWVAMPSSICHDESVVMQSTI